MRKPSRISRPRRDIASEITALILSKLEAGVLPWARPWDRTGGGGRRAKRQDTQAKRQASIWANRIRRKLLGDDADDTGCGLKAFRRDVFLRLPYFDHIHRYLPALMIREGFKNQYLDVNHRHREVGRSKYTNWGRLRASFSDLLGVMWLKTRSRKPGAISEF